MRSFMALSLVPPPRQAVGRLRRLIFFKANRWAYSTDPRPSGAMNSFSFTFPLQRGCNPGARPYDPRMRATIILLLVLLALLGGCTHVTQLKNAKTGETARCGGEIWSPTAGANDDHCLKYFHQQGFDPVSP